MSYGRVFRALGPGTAVATGAAPVGTPSEATARHRRSLILRSVAGGLVAAAVLSGCATPAGPIAAASHSAGRTHGPGRIPSGLQVPSANPPIPSNAPKCRMPRKIPTPSWYPSDLPLPPGSYHSQVLTTGPPSNRSMFFVPGTLVHFARFVRAEWPRRGWKLGLGELEPDEVEDTFTKSPANGAFSAEAQSCVPGYLSVLLIFDPGT
jgi:hypothetical protein